MKKNNPRIWHALAGVSAFAGGALLFTVNSYAADLHHTGWLHIVGGVAFAFLAAYCLSKAIAGTEELKK